MELLSNKEMIQAGKLIPTGEVCQEHNLPYYQLKTQQGLKEPFCEECNKKIIKQIERDGVIRSLNHSSDFHSYEVFERESIISSELKLATFESFNVTNDTDQRALNFARRITQFYFKGGRGNTLFSGNAGVGKSHLAISMAKRLNNDFKNINEPKSIIFMPVSRLFSKIQASFNGQSQYTEDHAVRLLSKTDFLVLDDLGVENVNNSWKQQVLTDILDSRNKTIITTNSSSRELEANYTPRLYDRILKGVKKDEKRKIESKIFYFPSNTTSKRREAF